MIATSLIFFFHGGIQGGAAFVIRGPDTNLVTPGGTQLFHVIGVLYLINFKKNYS